MLGRQLQIVEQHNSQYGLDNRSDSDAEFKETWYPCKWERYL